ncbi:MAG: ATP-binding protein [Cyanobacteria bacterium]|nr:ATP-binding protein [Cyanobacteria bacterium CG_2015-22_32_23]NCS84499.1 ATP-binding protein [Cyanobacteria bacterium CG_2015-02_32_10]
MNVNEVLHFVDHLVVEKTGKHLDDVQKVLIEGIWQRQSYDEIAKECSVTKGHMGDVSSKLMQILSEELGENIKKSNFRSTLERAYYLKSSQNPKISDHSNICGNNNLILQAINKPQKQALKREINTKSKFSHQDLSIAPKIIKFYPRETELKTLSNWIFNQNISLISVLGLSGIGKSYLVKRFVDLNLDKFEVIIWKSLKCPASFDLLIDEIFKICEININQKNTTKLNQLFELLRARKCLLIFDELENLFMEGQLAGQCQSQYEDYQSFFKRIRETDHQSHAILISQEKCQEMKYLDCNLYPIKCLELSGLKNVEIFFNMGLKDEDSWLNLLNLYEGNPYYLQNIIYCINSIFDGSVSDFLAENELIITKDIESKLELLFNRLSPKEQKIISKLSNSDQLLSREDLKVNLEMSSTDLINGLESLKNRYLLTKIKGDKIMFNLSHIFKEYVRNYC